MQLLMTIQREEKESKICGGAFWIPNGCPPFPKYFACDGWIFSKFDNCLIRSSATDIFVLSIIGPSSHFMKTSFWSNHARTQKDKMWTSDASWFATFAYSIKGEKLYLPTNLVTNFESNNEDKQPAADSFSYFSSLTSNTPPLLKLFVSNVRILRIKNGGRRRRGWLEERKYFTFLRLKKIRGT